jgi:2-dehydro-3-deoxygluconokinase
VTSIDTVGAGDAFTAGYLSALLDGGDVPARLERGTVLGAFAVSTAGDWEGLPGRDELAMLAAAQSGATVR